MSTRQQASRSSAQKSLKCGSKSPFNESRKMKTKKECVGHAMGEELNDRDMQNHGKLSEIYSMQKTVMAKLDRLNDIKKRIVNVEQDVKPPVAPCAHLVLRINNNLRKLSESIGTIKGARQFVKGEAVEMVSKNLHIFAQIDKCLFDKHLPFM